jgi:putative transposase
MKYDPQKHHRRSIRLPEYDYTQPGAYFITIVTVGKMNLFGEIHNGEMILNELGQIALGHGVTQ